MRSALVLVAPLVLALGSACMNGTAETQVGDPGDGTEPTAMNQLTVHCVEPTGPLPADGAGRSVVVTGESPVTATRCGSTEMTEVPLSTGQHVPIVSGAPAKSGQTVDVGVDRTGNELVFALTVQGTGQTFYSGPASRNADGAVHAAALTREDGLLLVGFQIAVPDASNTQFNDVVILMSGELQVR